MDTVNCHLHGVWYALSYALGLVPDGQKLILVLCWSLGSLDFSLHHLAESCYVHAVKTRFFEHILRQPSQANHQDV